MPKIEDDRKRILLLSYIEEKTEFSQQYTFVHDKEGNFVKLGEGASGHVYLAKKSIFGTEYAVKVIGFGESSDPHLDKLSELGQLFNQCNNIVKIHDFQAYSVVFNEDYSVKDCKRIRSNDEKEDGRMFSFIIMDKLDSIVKYNANYKRECLVKNLLTSRKEVLKLAKQVGDAISVAHGAQIAHRDIKLENIFIDPIDGSYKLGDFGTITKVKETGTARTKTGTSGMMAPEVASSMEGKYNAFIADIYSFGMTIYLLLNNLVGDEPRKSENDLLVEPVNGWDEINKIVMKALEYYPENRYQSIQDMLSDLNGIVISDDGLQKRDDVAKDTENIEKVGAKELEERPKISILPAEEPKVKVSVIPNDATEKKADEEVLKNLKRRDSDKKNNAAESTNAGDKYFVESKIQSDDSIVENKPRIRRKRDGKLEKIRKFMRIPVLLLLALAVVQNVSRIDFSANNNFSGTGFLLLTIACSFLTVLFLIRTKVYMLLAVRGIFYKTIGLGITIYSAYCLFNYHSHLYLLVMLLTIASIIMENWAMELSITIGMILTIVSKSYGVDISVLTITDYDWLLFAVAYVSFWAVLKYYAGPDSFTDFINVIQILVSIVLLVAGIVIVILSKTGWVQVSYELVSIRVYIAAILSAIVAFIGFMDYE